MSVIYLDYNASTPADPRVVQEMLPYFTETPGNAASVDHAAGHAARQGVERSREQIATLVDAQPNEIVFTSGATEADNLAVLGTLPRAPDDAELIVSAIEHPAVLEAAQQWGDRLRVIGVDSYGIVDPDDVKAQITSRTALVSVMTANNETGSVQPIADIAAICAEAQVPFHTDAVQAAARLPIAQATAGAQMVSLSAHKMYGPKGVGALVLRRGRPHPRIAALHHGGGHERGLRPGTLNVPAIVGFGKAAELVRKQGKDDWAREQDLKHRLITGLREQHPQIKLNGSTEQSLPQTASILLPGIDAHAMLRLISSDLAISTGSACSTTNVEPSHVLLAQGLSPAEAGQSLRLSFGRFTSEGDIGRSIELMTVALHRLQPLSGAQAA
jgi:cysteine desulfurase